MKKSITLFLTLIFLISAITIIASILKIYQKTTSSSFEFISQNSKIIQNIEKFFSIIDINQTKMFFNIPLMFSSKEGDFRITIFVNPICKININDYVQKNKINQNIDTLIDFLTYKYEIQDPLFLKDLLIDSIDKNLNERSPYSEIALQNPKFQNGYIYSYKQLKDILNYYANKTEDKRVFNIPWKKIFNFKYTQLLKSCANKNILTLNDENKTKFNIITINSVKYLKLNITYTLKNIHKLNIIYDLKQKKVVDIEENPLY